MARPSDKTPEQLAILSREKNKAMALRSIDWLSRLLKKRDVDKAVKEHIRKLIAEELEPLAEGVGPQTQSTSNAA